MRADKTYGVVAAAATLLAAAPLSAIFARWTWLFQCVVVVALVAAAAALTRHLRAPVWAQGLGMTVALLLGLTWVFPSGEEFFLLPTPATVGHFADLVRASATDMRSHGVPVPDTDPLLFITVLGVGAVAVLVDLLAVGIRRPALAGLPMLAIYSVPVAVYVDSVPAVPFAVGAAGYLWLLVADSVDRVRRFGRRFTGDGRDISVWEPSPLASAGRRLAVVGVVVAILLPLAVPGMTSGLFDRFATVGDGTGTGTGSGRVDLFAALSGELTRPESVVMVRLATNEAKPFYLRFGVAEDLRPNGFRVTGPNGPSVADGLPEPVSPAGVDQTRFRAEVEITEDFRMPLLPLYLDPVGVRDLDPQWRYDPNQQVIFSAGQRSQNTRYGLDYVRSSYPPEVLDRLPSLDPDDPLRRRFTARPAVPEVERLVQRLTAGKSSDYARVRAIYDYFSEDNGFSYSLRTEGGTAGSDIVNFLNNKVGYCQQYAAAMAWLTRAAGVPARVAFGFTSGERGDDGRRTLYNRNLHAWTEVYFTGIGWVPFDTTPSAFVPGSVRSAWAPDVDEEDPSSPTAPTAQPGAVDPSTVPDSESGTEEDPDSGFAGTAGEQTPRRPLWHWYVAGAVGLLVVLAVVPALRRAMTRRNRRDRFASVPAVVGVARAPAAGRTIEVDRESDRFRAQAHASWDELIDTLVDHRIEVDPAETPRATAERLARSTLRDSGAGEAVRLLGRAEERARYAREPLRDSGLGAALRSVRQAVARGASRRTRATAVLLPPSVLLRWRLTTAEAATQLVIASGQVRGRLLGWLPRRLAVGRTTR